MSNPEDSLRRPAKGPRIGLAQIAPSLGDLAANLEQHRQAIDKAAADGCDLLVFPELSLAGYRLKDSVPDVAVKRGSETWKELEELSKKLSFVVGFVEESPDHLFYNSAAWFEAGRCLAVHRKTYLPTYGMFDEQRYFARGRSIAAFDTKCGRAAMLICEDMLHPSAVTVAACDGATLLVVPSVSPARGVTGEGEADTNARSWESYLQVMARSFGLWIAYCNRTGVEDGVSFWGGSEIVSPAGERLAKGAYYDEDFVAGVLSDDAVRRRRIANPLVRDEDLDLTINELSRIRGRAVEKTAKSDEAAPRERAARPRDSADGEGPPKRFDRKPREFEGAPRKFDGPPRGFDRDEGDERRPRFGQPGFRPRGSYEQRGGFAPRGRRDDEGGDRPRFDKGGFDKPRFSGGGDKPRFSKPGFDKPGFDKPRFGGPPRGRFGGSEERGGGFGPPRDRDDRPRPGGFGPPRGRFTPRDRDDREGGGFGAKPRFGDGPPRPRERQRPEPRKPFHKGAAKPRGRKDR